VPSPSQTFGPSREGGDATVDPLGELEVEAEFRRGRRPATGGPRGLGRMADRWRGVTTMVNCAGIFRREDVLAITEDEFDLMTCMSA
jgi:hypothetical protein